MACGRLPVFLGCISLSLLLCVALPPAGARAQGPSIRLLDVPPSGRSYRYQELSTAGGFAITVANDHLTRTATVTVKIVEPWPCDGRSDTQPAEVASLCATEVFTSPVATRIKPGGSERFQFKLVDPNRQVKSGTYDMTLVAESDPPATIVQAPLSIEVLSPKCYACLVEFVLSRQYPLERLKDLLPLAVILVIGLLVVNYLQAHLRKANLGTVTLKVEDETALSDRALKPDFVAQVKDRLDELGILPPEAQPAASLAMEVAGKLLAQTAGPAGILNTLLSLAQSILSPAVVHTAECTLLRPVTDDGVAYPFRAMIEVKATRTGACYGIEILRAEELEHLALQAACHIYLQVVNRRQKHWTPKWQQFSSVEALVQYQEAQRQRSGCRAVEPNAAARAKAQQAEATFREIARREPGNLAPRMALASQLTANNKHDDAIKLYEEIHKLYPDLIEPHYRLAALKSMTGGGSSNQGSCNPYRDVQRRLSAHQCLWKWLQHRDERGYWTVWAPWRAPWRCERLRFKRMVDLAQSCREMADLAKDVECDKGEAEKIDKGEAEKRWFIIRLRLFISMDISSRLLHNRLLTNFRPGLNQPVENQHKEKVEKLIRQVDARVRPARRRYKGETGSKHLASLYYWTKPLAFWSHWGMNSWRARYNAACFYAIALRIPDGNTWHDHCARTALEQLTRAMTDPESIDAWNWVEKDPDLKTLTGTEPFAAWKKDYLIRKIEPCAIEEQVS